MDGPTWIGQNKRTGAIGSFPQLILVPSRTVPSKKGQKSADEDAVKLIDFENEDKMGVTVRPAPARQGWVTFESTTDLPSSSNDRLKDGTFDSASKNCGVVDKTFTTKEVKSSPANRMKISDIRNSQQVDVPDSACLLPGAQSGTSLSEPCSPAHQTSGPDLAAAAIDNLSFDPQDNTFCKSLPDVDKVASDRIRLSSASCDDLSTGTTYHQSPATHYLFPSDRFAENMGKASSDSHVDGRSASAPPIPPRDYPKRGVRTPPTILEAHPHPVIHPILQDGKQRSNTHYWLLPEKRSQLKMPEDDPPPPPPHSWSMHSPYINMSDSVWRDGGGGAQQQRHPRSISGDAVLNPSSGNPLSLLPSARETSMGEACEMIRQVRSRLGVESVTDDEIQTALSGNRWSVDLAVKYLKVEHLFRLGLASRQACRAVLDAHRWDLQPAASALVDRCTSL